MADLLVLGAGLTGLSAAVLLANDGHHVTVLERDAAQPGGPADTAWRTCVRPGVNQFRLPHYMQPRWSAVMEREIPAVIRELLALGAERVNVVGMLPSRMTGGTRADDTRFETVTARRPVLEAALATVAAGTDGVEIRRGVAVRGLLTRSQTAPFPYVSGVLLDDGTAVEAGLVIDAMGRHSPAARMLQEAGARRPLEEREDAGFAYYARHFRSSDGTRPDARGSVNQAFESISLLTLPCDNATWAVAFVTSARDKQLRALRRPDVWEAALSLFPTAAHWGEGEPLGPVQVIAGIEDRRRRFVLDGAPVATGFVAVGDAWASTNPALGRGAAMGLLQACLLRDVVRRIGPEHPFELVTAFDEATERSLGPLYRRTLAVDRYRLAEVEADVAGQRYAPADPEWALAKAMCAAALRDPDALRAYMSVAAFISDPGDALADAAVREKVLALGIGSPQYPIAGPSRGKLLETIHTLRRPSMRLQPTGTPL